MLNWGGLSSWNTRHKNFSKRGILFYELIRYWKSQIPRFSKMFDDDIGSLLSISTVPLRLHAAHVWRMQVFQGGGKFTMNKSLNFKRIVSKLSVFLKVCMKFLSWFPFFYRATEAEFSYNVTSHKQNPLQQNNTYKSETNKVLCNLHQQHLVIYSYESDWRIVLNICKLTGSSFCWCQRPWHVVACWKWCRICGGSAPAYFWFVKSWSQTRWKHYVSTATEKLWGES